MRNCGFLKYDEERMADLKALQEAVAKSGKALAHSHNPKDILLSAMEELGEVVRAYLYPESILKNSLNIP